MSLLLPPGPPRVSRNIWMAPCMFLMKRNAALALKSPKIVLKKYSKVNFFFRFLSIALLVNGMTDYRIGFGRKTESSSRISFRIASIRHSATRIRQFRQRITSTTKFLQSDLSNSEMEKPWRTHVRIQVSPNIKGLIQ